MRIHRFVLGSSREGARQRFRNLKNVELNLDESHWVTVLLGGNGTGKSNVLEAIAIIFRELVTAKNPTIDFAFEMTYSIGAGVSTRRIKVDHDPDRPVRERFIIHVTPADVTADEAARRPNGVTSISKFVTDPENLPRHVFSYYSGQSTRLQEVFDPYLDRYDGQLRSGGDPGLKQLFYATPVHSQFVLLAFLISPDDFVAEFLQSHLGIDPHTGIESVLFVLRQPPWRAAPDGDPRFWGAKGVVGSFLSRLHDTALAPVTVSRRVQTAAGGSTKREFKYLYVRDIENLRKLVGNQSPAEFFRDLESTNVSQLIEEVRIRVRLSDHDETVTFRELSEGEQQLLTVLGLLRFTAGGESLILLDEPDTHLNPRWSIDYLRYLKAVMRSSDEPDTSHIVMTTHNPLAIAELEREQVQILRRGTDGALVAATPDQDPRGMGFAGIVTSDMFGLDTALDLPTVHLLEEQRTLSLLDRDLDRAETARLNEINAILENYGFRYSVRDPDFEAYLRDKYATGVAERTEVDSPAEAKPSLKVREIIERAAERAGLTEKDDDATYRAPDAD